MDRETLGAIGNGYNESDLNRKVANDLFTRLKNKGMDVVLYPTERNLFKTGDYSFFEKGSYVLEIHLNAHDDKTANGTELLIKEGFTPDSIDNTIYNTFSKFFRPRGIKLKNNLKNMNNFASKGIGYSLIEMCFISNENDISIFNSRYDEIISELENNLVYLLGNKVEIITPAETIISVNNTDIKKGDKVKVLKAIDYKGTKLLSSVLKNTYDVIEVKGDRIVIGKGKNVTSAMKISDLQKV